MSIPNMSKKINPEGIYEEELEIGHIIDSVKANNIEPVSEGAGEGRGNEQLNRGIKALWMISGTLVIVLCIGLLKLTSAQAEIPKIFVENLESHNILGAGEFGEGGEVVPSSYEVVGSRNGGKYHYPWCSGAKQIKDSNLIYFNTIDEARALGYLPAKNCKGLK